MKIFTIDDNEINTTSTSMPSASPQESPAEIDSPTSDSKENIQKDFLTDSYLSKGINDDLFIKGELSQDKKSWSKSDEEFIPETDYRWVIGTIDDYNKTRYYSGDFSNRKLKKSEKGSFRSNIGDDQTVGVAAPIIITFDTKVDKKYRADVEKNISVQTKDKEVEGSWGWLADDAEGSRLHYRTKEYWPSHTDVQAKLNLKNIRLNKSTWE